jgi:hypothetical protein
MALSENDMNYENLKYNGWNQVEKTITFDGGTTNGIGDESGTSNPFTIFNVTGDVIVKTIGICKTDLAGAGATLEIGTAIDTDGLIAQTTATNIDEHEFWHDNSPDSDLEASSVMTEKIVADSDDIIGTVGTADITAGVIKFICLWKRLGKIGKVEAA